MTKMKNHTAAAAGVGTAVQDAVMDHAVHKGLRDHKDRKDATDHADQWGRRVKMASAVNMDQWDHTDLKAKWARKVNAVKWGQEASAVSAAKWVVHQVFVNFANK